MRRVLFLQQMPMTAVDTSVFQGDADSTCSAIGCNTNSTCSEETCSNTEVGTLGF